VRGIEGSDSLLLLASANAVSSIQVLSEVEQAHKRQKPIYTVLVGKTSINRELDYYISRLHWIEYVPGSVEHLADRLAAVLSGKKKWSEEASPPSLRRTVLYRRDAFMGSALATLFVVGLAGIGLAYWNYHQEVIREQDYASLGWVEVSGADYVSGKADSDRISLHALVVLTADGVPFRDMIFLTAVQRPDGSIETKDQSRLLNPGQVGSMQMIDIALPANLTKLATCLVVPSPQLHKHYRITQLFSPSVNPDDGQGGPLNFMELTERNVREDDGTSCGFSA
jgi:hypothetical protein